MSCICALTAQNTKGVTMVVNTPVDMVRAGWKACLTIYRQKAVKTGMLSSAPIVKLWRISFPPMSRVPLVVDLSWYYQRHKYPLEKEAIQNYKESSFLSTLILPMSEAEVLSAGDVC